MLGRDFKRWAAHGVRNYGTDPWHFLRELVQNARDAGASAIRVQSSVADGREVIAFDDDGTGMGLEHARRYLFRLYASSKRSGERFAGEFGIGFWTVLHFGFERLLVESRTPREAWAVALDREFAATPATCSLDHRGTRITLSRPTSGASERELRSSVRGALTRYCRCLHQLDQPDRPLPVLVDGVPLEQGLRLDSPLQLRFRDGQVEGAVGLAAQPRVELYARGLPVWRGLVIDELSHVGAPDRYRVELARGLAPVFLLNGRRLRVDATRSAVLDDNRLAQLRGTARRALDRLVRRHLQQQFPRSPWGRLLDRGRDLIGALERRHWVYLGGAVLYLAALAAVVAIATAPRWRHTERIAATQPADVVADAAAAASTVDAPGPAGLPSRYTGAQVDAPDPDARHELSYQPPATLWFRLLVAEKFETERGLVAVEAEPAPRHASYLCRRDCVDVEFRAHVVDRALLPLPLGYEVEPGSVRFEDTAIGPLLFGAAGERLVVGPSGVGTLRYRIGPLAPARQLSGRERRALLELPRAMPWPDDLAAALRRGQRLPLRQRVALAARLTSERIAFDNSVAVRDRYRSAPPDGDWLTSVLAIRAGDCDVINGLHVALLRHLGVPARLAVGMVGRAGVSSGGLHAWTEYFDRGWHSVDASQQRPQSTVAVAPVPLAAPAPAAAAPTAAAPTTAAPMTPAAPVESPRPARQLSRAAWRALLAAAIACVAIGLAIGIWFALRHRQRGDRFERRADEGAAQQILVEMLINALAQPAAWRSARPIWSHPVLPLLDGGRMAIGRAVRLAQRHQLFAGRSGQALSQLAVAAGTAILDLGHPQFASAIASVRGLIDLGRYELLRPLAADAELVPHGRALLTAANQLLRDSGSDVVLLPFAGNQARTFFDVDLSELRLPANPTWPRRYVAVASESPFFCACAEAMGERPGLARFRLVHAALRSSLFFVDRFPRLLRGTAQRALQEAST